MTYVRRTLVPRLVLCALMAGAAAALVRAAAVPALTQPVNDFAHIIDSAHAATMDRAIRALQGKTGDTVVVATIPSYEPEADIRDYAVQLFENGGRGIGEKGKNNGILVLLALKERRVWIEVGYDLEEIVTDGYAGETSRQFMVPHFKEGDYGGGLEAGVMRLIGRIAEVRHVTLDGVPRPEPTDVGAHQFTMNEVIGFIVLAIVIIRILNAMGGGGRGGWGRRSTWSGWSSGIGPFGGGGFGGGWGSGGGGGGGFGGGFGGFGGGRSGGGGGGASW